MSWHGSQAHEMVVQDLVAQSFRPLKEELAACAESEMSLVDQGFSPGKSQARAFSDSDIKGFAKKSTTEMHLALILVLVIVKFGVDNMKLNMN